MSDTVKAWITSVQKWQHDAIPTVSIHHLIRFHDDVDMHHCRFVLILSHWTRSLRQDCSEATENNGDITKYGHNVDGYPPLDITEQTGIHSKTMASDLHRCDYSKECKRVCSCQKKGNEWTCLNCSFCYECNKTEPQLRKNKPPETCQNNFNLYANWHVISTCCWPHIITEPLPQREQTHGPSHLLRVEVTNLDEYDSHEDIMASVFNNTLYQSTASDSGTASVSQNKDDDNVCTPPSAQQFFDEAAVISKDDEGEWCSMLIKRTFWTTEIITTMSTTRIITARITHALPCQTIIFLHMILSITR